MNVEPVQLNVREGSKPYMCFSCRPTPAHYREAGRKLVQDLLDQRIIERCGASRIKYCAQAHFVEKPGRVPLALCLVLDFTCLNEQLIRNQPQWLTSKSFLTSRTYLMQLTQCTKLG